jgi:pantoate--beta-alanine ligase
MVIIKSKTAIRTFCENAHNKGKTIAFVPTMGALHEGHLSLVRKARKLCDIVVASIYVNPSQFSPSEDFSRYPRPFNNDTKLLKSEGVDVLFAPSQMYSDNSSVVVEPGEVSTMFCGKSRPFHFRGVATIVLKFFNLICPDIAIFGQKDAQQVAIIKKMVNDFDLNVKIVVQPTIRDSKGLALSSRNKFLNPADYINALSIYAALSFVKKEFKRGIDSKSVLLKKASSIIQGDLEYIAAVDPCTFLPVKKLATGVVLVVAAKVGKTRLIDNMIL